MSERVLLSERVLRLLYSFVFALRTRCAFYVFQGLGHGMSLGLRHGMSCSRCCQGLGHGMSCSWFATRNELFKDMNELFKDMNELFKVCDME